VIKVDPNASEPPGSFPAMADPFDGGIAEAAPPKGGAATGGRTGGGSGSMGEMSGIGGGASSQAAACAPKGTKLSIASTNAVFSTDSLAAPAGEPFTIAFDNRDAGVPHNVSIYTDDSASQALFTGDVVSGPKKIAYEVPALDPGAYFFRCDVHPATMTGTFVVG
jgi:plastocyanin